MALLPIRRVQNPTKDNLYSFFIFLSSAPISESATTLDQFEIRPFYTGGTPLKSGSIFCNANSGNMVSQDS